MSGLEERRRSERARGWGMLTGIAGALMVGDGGFGFEDGDALDAAHEKLARGGEAD